MIYLFYSFIFYVVGVLIALLMIAYDNWLLSNYPIADIKFDYRDCLSSWLYVFVYIKANY